MKINGETSKQMIERKSACWIIYVIWNHLYKLKSEKDLISCSYNFKQVNHKKN